MIPEAEQSGNDSSTQYALDNLSLIRGELYRWTELSAYLGVSLFLLLVATEFNINYSLCIVPLTVYEIKIIVRILLDLKRTPSASEGNLQEIIESLCGFVAKAFAGAYFIVGFPFIYISLPLTVSIILRTIFKPTSASDCQDLSSLLGSIIRWVKLLTVLCVGLKLNGFLEWSWHSTFWPIWAGCVLLLLLSFGNLVLIISTYCLTCLGSRHVYEAITPTWLFYITSTSSVTLSYLFFSIGEDLEYGGDSLLYPISLAMLNLFLFIFISKLIFPCLV